MRLFARAISIKVRLVRDKEDVEVRKLELPSGNLTKLDDAIEVLEQEYFKCPILSTFQYKDEEGDTLTIEPRREGISECEVFTYFACG